MAVTTRQGLIEYSLRALGEPVVEVNVEDSQVEDRVDEAIEYFREYHYDGMEKVLLKHQITQTDIDNKWIPIPDLVYGVVRVFPIASSTSSSQSLFDLQYQLRLNDLYDLTSTSMIYYTQVQSHLSLINMTLNGQPQYRFNRITDKLYLDVTWGNTIVVGTYILLEAYRAMDPATVTKVYNNSFLKHYTTALIKKQWATNLKKWSGMALPGGITMDGNALYDEAMKEIDDLETELMDKSAPLSFSMG